METRVRNVVLSLDFDSEDVCMIGIKGMGGGGKTTLARAVFDHISGWFEGKSFVENVREVSKGNLFGLKELQKQIISDVLNDQSIVVKSVSEGKYKMKKMMGSRKVLVVLDDVDNIGQLEALAGQKNWFKPGSRIVITTRDEQVLVAHRVNFIRDVTLLSHEEAICLFNRYAFGREIPNKGYEELSGKVVEYAAGLPLTIKVLGSFLCGRVEHEWEDAIRRLKTIPLNETLEKLELSYNGLEDDQKEIFLDVACILKGEKKKKAIRILESCGFNAHIGLRVLEQKSLITISHDDCLDLHDHIVEMAMNIVSRSHPDEPHKHSRLCITNEIEDIEADDLGTSVTRSLKLQYTNFHPDLIMKGLKKMKELRFLYVDNYTEGETDEGSQYLPNTVRCLHWYRYPFWCLPKTFQAKNLVDLALGESNIHQLWEGGEIKILNKLRFLDLSGSRLRTFDLGTTPYLEKLDLVGCNDFVELHIPVECPKLKSLYLSGCKLSGLKLGLTPNLETLNAVGCTNFVELHMPIECPKLKSLVLCDSKLGNLNLGLTPQLEILDLKGCYDFVELQMPFECPKLKVLNLNGSMVSDLNIGLTPNLKTLDLAECYEFVELHQGVECPKLKVLNLNGSKVSNFNLGLTPHLEKLDLSRCYDFVELHIHVECPKLKVLNINGSKVSNLNLGLTPRLERLYLEGCNYFLELHIPVECPKLKVLVLSGSKVSNFNLGLTPHLETLDLAGCNGFVELHMPSKCLKLKFLNLSGSKVSNLKFGLTPHLEGLDLKDCYYLQEIHAQVGCLEKLVYLNLSGCLRFEHFSVHKRYDLPSVTYETRLQLSAESLDICPLHPNNNLPKFRFKCKYDEPLPSSSGNIEKHISLGLCACTNLESFSASICGLQRLRRLTLEGSIPLDALKDLYHLESLEELTLSIKKIKHLPDSICKIKHLKSLELTSCWLLEQLPNDLGGLGGLVSLNLKDCISLRDIPNSICKIKYLRYLSLTYSILVEKLPEELGCLRCLHYIDIQGAGISRLPQSIYELKGLRIIGSRWRLESYGFTSLKEISRYVAMCHV